MPTVYLADGRAETRWARLSRLTHSLPAPQPAFVTLEPSCSVPRFLEELLPSFDIETRSSIEVAAAPQVVYRIARTLDMSGSWLIRTLFRLRGMPLSALNADGLGRIRFKPIHEEPPKGFALGVIGRFWTASGHLVDFAPEHFTALDSPGYAKAIWSFDLTPLGERRTSLRTVTRVLALDDESRRSFTRYWTVVGPFSGVIRSRVLRSIREEAERAGPDDRGVIHRDT